MLFSLLATAGVASAFPWGSGNGGFGSHGGNTGPSFSGSHGGNTGPSFSGSHGGNSGSPFSGSHGSAASSGSNGFPAFVPPGEGDVRSPCPALNTLANHGYLPHSGKGITTDDIIKGFMAGQNFAADTVTGAAAGALALCSRETGTNCTSWDLDMLDKPHEIEHDNSLSREDYNYGQDNNTVFSNRVWNQVLGIWRGARIIDFKLATAAITERVAVTSRFDAPGWYVNATGASFHETAFYISLFGDPVEGNARQDWINVWFEQERMPFELDWTPTQRQTITEASLDAMVEKLEAAQTGFGSGTHFAHSRTNSWWKFGGN